MIYNQLKAEYDRLNSQLQDLTRKLSALPAGHLLLVKNGNYFKWFKSNGKAPVYLPKKSRPLAEALALKKYYSLQIETLSQEIQFLEQWLKYREKSVASSTAFLKNPGYRELLKPCFQTFSDIVAQWLAADYEHSANHPENLIHTTLSGHKVRSKSEVIIANTLFVNKIPYRYECGIHFENIVFYPDFTILHPETSEIFYWEHFGMMNNPSYCENAFNKLKIYGNHGIIPTVNLITTYETQARPIDSEKITLLIQEYFL